VGKLETGRAGENAAARHLRRHGYRIIERNLRLGRLGEIDIVAEKRGVLAIVEVKSVIAGTDISGFEHITAAKQRKLTELAQAYIQQERPKFKAVRFDAVEVVFADASLRRYSITHLEDAFRAG